MSRVKEYRKRDAHAIKVILQILKYYIKFFFLDHVLLLFEEYVYDKYITFVWNKNYLVIK